MYFRYVTVHTSQKEMQLQEHQSCQRHHCRFSTLFFIIIFVVFLDFLVMHLQELVRMVFIAATAICDQLKLAGLSTLQVY